MRPREMKDLYAGFASAAWPRPADKKQAEIQAARWEESVAAFEDPALRKQGRQIATSKTGRTILDAVFGNSPFLGEGMAKDAAFTVDLLRRGPDAVTADLLAGLRSRLGAESDEAVVMTELRCANRQAALAISLPAIPRLCSLYRITHP